jgi:two-component system, sporulation sensor kinase A
MIKEESHQINYPDIKDLKNISFALTNSPDLISSHLIDGTFTYISSSSEKMLGYLPAELIGRSIFTLCHPLDIEKLKRAFLPALRVQTLFRFKRKEGDYIWVESSGAKALHNSEIILILRDVTRRVTKEEKVKEKQKRDRLFLENSKDTMGIITPEGIWTYINERGKKLLGTTSVDEIIGTSLCDYIQSSHDKKLRSWLKSRESVDFEISLFRKDHEEKKTEIQLIPTIFKNRDVFLIIIKDITEHRKTEEQLQDLEKLSLIGQMAAGIAHEIRNPLTSIKGFTQLMKEDPEKDYAEIILNELSRIESIVGDLLVLAKPQASDLTNTDLVLLVNGVVKLLNPQAILSDIIIEIKSDNPHLYIDCEKDKIKQVLINLIQNSIEAMENGGAILMTISKEADSAAIKVIDHGIGIPEDRLSKLGEPFYSTKEKGTGLGLMICQKIIKNHGGALEFSSQVNQGTTAKILLPCKQ